MPIFSPLAKLKIDVIDGEVFNVPCETPFCSKFSSPPQDPCFTCLFPPTPAELVDTFVTTPGSTSFLGADFPGDGTTTTMGDLSNDGPQNHFQFARVTVSNGATGLFSGKITVAGSTGPEDFPFSFVLGVPEPTSRCFVVPGLLACSLHKRKDGMN